MFTDVSSPLHWNLSTDTVPDVLKGAPQFLLNNPIVLQKRYLKLKDRKLKDHPNMNKRWADLQNAVKAAEQNALGMLVDLFDWLDGLVPQPTTEVVEKLRRPRPRSPTLALSDGEARRSAVSGSSCLHLALLTYPVENRT